MLQPLNETRTVKLDGSGNGLVKAMPLSARETWYPANVHVSTIQTTVTNEAVCKIFVGDFNIQQNYRDTTFTGSSGDSTDKVNADVVKVGTNISAQWFGGDAGVFAVMVITGKKDV